MKKITKYIGTGLITQFLPLIALAQGETPQVRLDKNAISNILENFRDWVSGIVFILGMLMMLYAAFLFMTAGGDEEKTGKAKKTLTWGLVGVGVAMIAYGVFELVGSFLQ